MSVRRDGRRRTPEKSGANNVGDGGGRSRDRMEDGSKAEQFEDSESEISPPFLLLHPTIQRISPLVGLSLLLIFWFCDDEREREWRRWRLKGAKLGVYIGRWFLRFRFSFTFVLFVCSWGPVFVLIFCLPPWILVISICGHELSQICQSRKVLGVFIWRRCKKNVKADNYFFFFLCK